MYGKQSLFSVVLVSMIPCICFFSFPDQITGIFTSDPNIIKVCHNAMLVSSIGFQADAC